MTQLTQLTQLIQLTQLSGGWGGAKKVNPILKSTMADTKNDPNPSGTTSTNYMSMRNNVRYNDNMLLPPVNSPLIPKTAKCTPEWSPSDKDKEECCAVFPIYCSVQ